MYVDVPMIHALIHAYKIIPMNIYSVRNRSVHYSSEAFVTPSLKNVVSKWGALHSGMLCKVLVLMVETRRLLNSF